jgi:hypothetical protein
MYNPIPSDLGFCVVVPDFFSQQECTEALSLAVFKPADNAYPPSYRNNYRAEKMAPDLSTKIFDRLKSNPSLWNALNHDQGWLALSINDKIRFVHFLFGLDLVSGLVSLLLSLSQVGGWTCSLVPLSPQFFCSLQKFRFCEYNKGQQFTIHQDGTYFPTSLCGAQATQSKLSLLIYLTNGSDFEGSTPHPHFPLV